MRGTYRASAFTKVANASHLQINQASTYRNARADTAVRPYAEIFPSKVRESVGQANGATRGGMLSGSAASRTVYWSDIASQHAFGGYQGGHHPRWPIPPWRTES